MKRHTDYLELRLAECMTRPELHNHQIAALEELLDLARSGIDSDEYNRKAGHLFGLNRAEWLDRYTNLTTLHDALGDDRMRTVAEASLEVGAANSYSEMATAMSIAMSEAASLRLAASTAVDSLAPLVVSLLHWVTEGSATSRESLAETCKGLWRAIQTSDPGCSWERICTYPPYRNRLPFDANGLEMIGAWLLEAVGTQLADVPNPPPPERVPMPVPVTPDDPALPTIEEAARGYHAIYEAIRGDRTSTAVAVYERIFELEKEATCVNDFLCKLAETKVLCDLSRAQVSDAARAGLIRCAPLCQPLVETHYRSLLDALGKCNSVTAIEFEVARHDACFAVESAWHRVFIAFAFHTITNAMAFEFDRSDERKRTVRNSAAISERFFGNWEATFAIDRVWDFFSSVFFGFGRDLGAEPVADGAYRGEVGLDLLESFRHMLRFSVLEFDAANEYARFETAAEMRAHVTELYQSAVGEPNKGAEPSADSKTTSLAAITPPQGVIFWGQAVSFEALGAMMSSPPRPC